MENNKIPVTAATDLRAFQHRALAIGGTLALRSYVAMGLLETRTDSGEDATITQQGRARYIAGGANTRGDRLQVASGGFLTLAASGDYSVGICEITITSGSVGRGNFDFLTPMYHVNSSGV